MSSAAAVEPAVGQGSESSDIKQKKYLIIGCGPAGLIAARTLEQNGVGTDQIHIISKSAEKSTIGGAQFLHRPVIGESDPDAQLSICKLGDGVGYARKVYGEGAVATSFDRIGLAGGKNVSAWSLQSAYEQLWDDYAPDIHELSVNAEGMEEILNSGEWDEIICTIPPTEYCNNNNHFFKSVRILIGIDPIDEFPFDNAILYSGREEDSWYRMSSIFSNQSIELGSAGNVLDYEGLRKVAEKYIFSKIVRGLKPIETNCDCGYGHSTKLLRVGRFGMWDRQRLLHQVPAQVAEIL
jgi:hypothetical protein